MSRYVINVLASRDLNEIADYFVQTNLDVGERFFREFNRKCQQLTDFPSSGKRYLNGCSVSIVYTKRSGNIIDRDGFGST